MRLAEPWWLAAALALPIWWWFQNRRPKPSLNYSDASLLLAPTARSFRLQTRWLPTLLWASAILAAIVAMARPQVVDERASNRTIGRGISLVVDVSGSMGKTLNIIDGVRTTRLDRAKRIIEDLLEATEKHHPNDEFGLTVFAAAPKVLSPATTERPFVQRKLAEAEIDVRDNRTELGGGIALGLDLVGHREDETNAMVLFTDGAQRVEGALGPFTGARLAEALGIPIVVVHFADEPAEAEDRRTLERLSEIAKGRLLHWREANPQAILRALPPPMTTTSSPVIWRDAFSAWIFAVIGLLIASETLRATVYRMTPSSE